MEIARTDIDYLLPFLWYYPRFRKQAETKRADDTKFIDEVDWL